MDTLIGVLIAVVIVMVAVVAASLLRKQPESLALTQMRETVADLRVSIGAMSERVAQMEQTQSRAKSELSQNLSRTREHLASLQTSLQERRESERRTAESVRRLETVLSGAQSKGAAAENLLDQVFSQLPAEWQVRNFRIGGQQVEFGLRLANGLILPIDSKWTATALVEEFAGCREADRRARLKNEIRKTVLNRAKEVRKYIDPSLTVPFAVAALPDSVYELCPECRSESFRMNVVLVSHSLFVPYLLLVFHMALSTQTSVDPQRLEASLQQLQQSLSLLQDEVEGRLSRAITMLANSRDDMRLQIGRSGGLLATTRIEPDESPTRTRGEALRSS